MRNHRSALLPLSLLLVSFGAQAEEATPAPTRYIPSVNHFTVATPGAQWLNVSRELKPEDLRDRIVLLDFWTYCCVNCMQTLPELAKLEKEFGKDGFLVVGVHSAKFDNEKDTDNIRGAILRYGVEHPVVNDKDFRIWRAFDVRSWPTLILLKPNGDIDQKWTGEGNTDDIRKRIVALKKEFSKTAKNTEKIPYDLEKDKVAKGGEFFYPSKLAYDENSKTLFVSDSSHHQIAAYSWDSKSPAQLKPLYRVGKSGEAGFKDGSYSSARFRRPQGIIFHKGSLYVADTENHAVRKIDLKGKSVSTVAGTGKQGRMKTVEGGKTLPSGLPARSTALASPWDVAVHPDEDHLVIAMAGSHQLWSLGLKDKKLEVIAGSGVEAIDDGLSENNGNTLAQPSGLSSLLGSLYFVDAESSSLRFFFEGYVRTLVGSGLFDFGMKDGERKSAKLQHPLGLYADVSGIFIADTYNHSIRRYDAKKQTLETVVGDGKRGEGAKDKPEEAKSARLNEPAGIIQLVDGVFVIADTSNHRLVLWSREKNQIERMKIDGEKIPGTNSTVKEEEAKAAAKETVVARKRISIRLPNVIPSADAKVNRTTPEVKIILPEAYHLNQEGPSFATLFEGEMPKEVLKQEWSADDLKKSLTLNLKELKTGASYVLQGTFYFCLESKASVCEIASVNQRFEVDPSGTDSLEIHLSKK